MSTATNVPVTMDPDVMPYIAGLGFEAEFEAMLQHVRGNVPDLVRIEAEKFIRHDEDGPEEIAITAVTALPWSEASDLRMTLGLWRLMTFPRPVPEYFTFDVRSNGSEA